jgi:uncharacterized RDD family membrane protein YckC
MNIGTLPQATGGSPAYARFAPRLRALVIDSIVMMLALVAALVVAVALESDHVGRAVGFTMVALWLLYEPVLVSQAGGTIGHYLCNLRVVDDQSHGNVGFPKAVARVIIKTALGLWSFITMVATRRRQAVHDLFTRSTVQIRDLAKAQPYQYRGELAEPANPAMPSRGRRLLVIAAYGLASAVVVVFALYLAAWLGLVSAVCLANNQCSSIEHVWLNILGFGWVGLCALLVAFGWKGRLWGCRAGTTMPS